jgi:hypothetical protein
MNLRIDVEGTKLSATLDDGEASRDFASLLPLALTLEDYASTEKIADLPRRLSTKGAPPGTDAAMGDVSYYAPWGNLALFYRPARYASGLVRLGRIESDVEALRGRSPVNVKIELMEKQMPLKAEDEGHR